MTEQPQTETTGGDVQDPGKIPGDHNPRPTPRKLLEICGAFLKLGLTSFGGPIAHLGYLRAEFVQKRRWLDDLAYGDLVALCQFLPGPASSQTVYALGMHRAGIGAFAASACFTLPSAIVMIAFAYGSAAAGGFEGAGWLHGLKLAVAVVAQAVWGMGCTLCPDRTRLSMCLVAAAFLLAFPGAFQQVGIIAAGAVVGWFLYRRNIPTTDVSPNTVPRHHFAAATVLVLWGLLL